MVKKTQHLLIEWTYDVGAHWNCLYRGNSNVYQQHILLKTKKNVF